MTLQEAANERYDGKFVFMFGYLEGKIRYKIEDFKSFSDGIGHDMYHVSCIHNGEDLHLAVPHFLIIKKISNV